MSHAPRMPTSAASAAAPRIRGSASTTSSRCFAVRIPTDTSATTSSSPAPARTGTTARTDGPSVPTYSSLYVRPAWAWVIDPRKRLPMLAGSGWE